MDRVPGKYGRLPAVRLKLRQALTYMTTALPVPPQTLGYIEKYYSDVPVWPIDGNDTNGCCTFAGIDHVRQAALRVVGLPAVSLGADVVVKEYYDYTGGQDSGADEAGVLQRWQTRGIGGTKIDSFAPINHADHTAMMLGMQIFGALYVGFNVPADYSDLFAGGQPWDVSGRQIVGGHCVIIGDYDPDYLYTVTWGAWQKMTWRAWEQFGDEAWVVIPEEFVSANAGPVAGMDLAALRSDLAQLRAA